MSTKGEIATWKNYVVCCFVSIFFLNSSCLAALLDHSFGKEAYLPDEKWANSDPIDGPHAALCESMGFTLHKKPNQTDFLNREKREEEVEESKPGMFAQM